MLPEDGTGTQEREREWRKREKLSAVFVTFRVTVCCRKMERVRMRERVEKEREKLSAVFVTFRVTVCCRKMERVRRGERESG
jgi:hypothetical protein